MLDNESEWDEAQLQEVHFRYRGWPRLWLDPEPSGGPMTPHTSDDEDGSDVETWEEPLS